jgi:hypothetical protein
MVSWPPSPLGGYSFRSETQHMMKHVIIMMAENCNRWWLKHLLNDEQALSYNMQVFVWDDGQGIQSDDGQWVLSNGKFSIFSKNVYQQIDIIAILHIRIMISSLKFKITCREVYTYNIFIETPTNKYSPTIKRNFLN